MQMHQPNDSLPLVNTPKMISKCVRNRVQFTTSSRIININIYYRAGQAEDVFLTRKLQQKKFGDEGVAFLLKELQSPSRYPCKLLSLHGHGLTERVGDLIASFLKKDKNLSVLGLSGNSLGDNGVKKIAEALKVNNTLSYLRLGCNDLTDEGVKTIIESITHSNNNTLKSVELETGYYPETNVISEELFHKLNDLLSLESRDFRRSVCVLQTH